MIDTSTKTLSEWQMKRKGRFTASEIYKLFVEPRTVKEREAGQLSETAKGYIFEKAVEYATGFRKQVFAKQMEHGIVNEAEGFEAFKSAIGMDFELTSNQFFCIGDNAGASPDGVLFDGLDIVAVVDIKCPYDPVSFFQSKMELTAAEIPKTYFYQLQMQMLATGAADAFLARYLTAQSSDQYGNKIEYEIPADKRIFWTHVPADPSVHEQIIDKISLAENLRQEYIKQIMK
jgi:hypothetical protein